MCVLVGGWGGLLYYDYKFRVGLCCLMTPGLSKVTLNFLRGLSGCVWVNILTLSSQKVYKFRVSRMSS